ncbi:hypothetical protein EBZ39_15870 [bacterium]|nr:hypothetical protein [bacterium]
MEMSVIMWGLGMLGGLVGIYVRMETKMKELDVRVQTLEMTDKAMNAKLDEILKALHQLALDLKDKADRP